MSHSADRYYRDSGAVPLAGILLLVGCGVLTAGVLSAAYGFLDYYNPLIYVTFLATGALGLCTGMAVTFGANLGKVRNRLCTRFIGVVIGCLTIYLTWAWYLWAAQMSIPDLHKAIGLQEAELSFDPSRMLALIQVIAENGLWSMGSITPTGSTLYAFWSLEAVIIFVLIVMVAGDDDSAFCENCDAWAVDDETVFFLKNTEHAELISNLEDEQYKLLDLLWTGSHDSSDCLVMTLQTCPHCDESNHLSIKHISTTGDKKGVEEQDETKLIKNLSIPASLVVHLRAAALAELEKSATSADTEDAAVNEPLEDS